MYRETFPQKIKKARHDAGYTQRQVAEVLNLPQSTIAKYETGKLEPNLETLGLMADFYAVSLDWLLGTAGNNKRIA